MALEGVKERYGDLLNTIGTAALNALFPKDFEAYMISFELVDSQDSTLEFFSFPIMPESISIVEPEITSIRKTNRGITSLKTDSFIPRDINLTGNFGRTFRVLLRNKVIDFNSFNFRTGQFEISLNDYDGPTVKTGFGSMKVLQRLLNGSKVLDGKGNPCRLYFYNFAFSENYVVEVINKTFSQSKESNVIWNYNVALKAVAPINNIVRSRRSLVNILSSNALQKSINTLAANIGSILPDK